MSLGEADDHVRAKGEREREYNALLLATVVYVSFILVLVLLLVRQLSSILYTQKAIRSPCRLLVLTDLIKDH